MGNRRVTLLVGLASLCGVLAGCDSDGDSTETKKFGAVDVCKDFIEDRLRSPGSAEHPRNRGDARVAGDVFTVTSWVDSQNGFGALIRTNYTCVVRLDGDMWRLQSLDAA